MKKILATLMASTLALSLSSVALATLSVDPMLPNANTVTVPGSTQIIADPSKPNVNKLKVMVPVGFKGEINIAPLEGFPIYTWGGSDTIEFSLVPTDATGAYSNAKILNISSHVNSGNVNVSVSKNNGTTYSGGTAPSVKIKAIGNGTDFKYDEDLNNLSIDLDLTIAEIIDQKGTLGEKHEVTVTLKADASTAYSKTQELQNSQDITISKQNGSIVKFSDHITDKTRIRANENVDVFFKGNYGVNKENMRVITDSMTELDTYFADAELNVYDFAFNPKFASSVQVAIDGDQNAFVYEYNKKTGDVTKIKTAYENNAHRFETKSLTTYVVSTEEFEDGNVKGETTETPEDVVGGDTSDKTNPGTGASDVAAAAAAMATLSLCGAGAFMVKKFSK